VQHSRTEYSRQCELDPWTRQRSPVGERPQDPPADAVPEGPITSKALRESICQRGTPGIPKACAMVPMMWLLKAYRPESRPWLQRLNLSSASVSNAWDASSALLLKQAGFRALGTSSPPIAAQYDGQIHPGPVGFRGNRQAPRCVHRMSVCPYPRRLHSWMLPAPSAAPCMGERNGSLQSRMECGHPSRSHADSYPSTCARGPVSSARTSHQVKTVASAKKTTLAIEIT
jgi:hypothetical protein